MPNYRTSAQGITAVVKQTSGQLGWKETRGRHKWVVLGTVSTQWESCLSSVWEEFSPLPTKLISSPHPVPLWTPIFIYFPCWSPIFTYFMAEDISMSLTSIPAMNTAGIIVMHYFTYFWPSSLLGEQSLSSRFHTNTSELRDCRRAWQSSLLQLSGQGFSQVIHAWACMK